MKKIISITSIVFKSVIYLLLLFSIFNLITSKTNTIGGIRSFVVQSGSMQPAISVGSIIYTKKVKSYKEGDIIAFQNKAGQTVTHRVIEVISGDKSTFYKVKGDANNAADSEPVEHASVLGKTIFIVPYLGYLVQFLKTLPGFLLLIILPATVFIAFEIFNIKKELEKEIEKKILRKITKTGQLNVI